ncbi:MAG TPA: DoxX family protein [Kofleriaceae bacterium]|nr:DoxX family protein [Kofleriaceae bacterium]
MPDRHAPRRAPPVRPAWARARARGISVAARLAMRALVPIGRVLFALIFVASVIGHFSDAQIAQASAHGVPLATIGVPIAGLIALAGGVSIMLGYRARFGALLLLVFLVPVTLVMHKFWGLPDPQMAMMQRINFMKNTSLIGACLMIMYFGSGPYSLDT